MNGLENNNTENGTWNGMETNETGNIGSDWTNQTNNPRHICADSVPTIAVKTIMWGILMVASFLGNILIITVIRKSRELRRSPVNIFILSMSVSDLSIPLLSIPHNIKYLYVGTMWFGGDFGSILCKIVPFATDVPTAVSILTLLAIAVERFECVHCPTKQPFTARIHKQIVCLIWLFAAISHSFYLYSMQTTHDRSTSIYYCRPTWYQKWVENLKALRVQGTVVMAVLFHVPVILLTVLYSGIIVTLRRRKIEMAEHITSRAARKREKQNRKVAFMLVTVVAVFVVAYTPYTVFLFLFLFSPPGFQMPCDLSFIAHFLFYSYSAINPIIYYCFNNKYRQGFKQFLSCQLVFAKASRAHEYQLRTQSGRSQSHEAVELHRHSTLSTTAG